MTSKKAKNIKTIIIIGKSASGKTTVAKQLEKMGIKRIITDTTRSPRKGEINGKDYNFRTVDKFTKLQREGYYAETASYNASFGVCYYGSPKSAYMSEDFEKNSHLSVIVLNPLGLRQIIENDEINNKNYYVVYLCVPDSVLIKRLTERGDSEKEIKRRLEHDDFDFMGMEYYADSLYFLNGLEAPEKIAENIIHDIKHF